MLTLALDTTTKAGSVAVLQGNRLLAAIEGDAARTHGERLPAEMARALEAAGVTPGALQLLAVATGPGAFTGLRIGLAAMQGLAMVVGCPVVGVSALDALAAAALERADRVTRAVAPWVDAGRGEVFAALYLRDHQHDALPQAVSEPVADTPGRLLAALPPDLAGQTWFVGDGARRYQAELAGAGAGGADLAVALAPFIGRLGQQRAARGQAGPPHGLQPLYVRRPDAELERARKAAP